MNQQKKIAIVLFMFFLVASLFSQDLYWESPETLIPSNARFPQAKAGSSLLVVAWQEFRGADEENKLVSINMLVSKDGNQWERKENIIDQLSFVGEEASIFSLAVDSKDTIYIAIASGENSTRILSSTDGGNTFSLKTIRTAFSTTVAPKLSVRDDDGLILFVNQDVEDSLSIFYSVSDNARVWTDFQQLSADAENQLNFLPSHVSFNGTEYVVYQSFGAGASGNYQLFSKYSRDGGRSWTQEVRVTDFEEIRPDTTPNPDRYDNQRPYVAVVQGKLYLTWERKYARESKQVYLAELGTDGKVVGNAEKVTSGFVTHNFPQIITVDGKLFLVWFDNRKGDDHIIIASKRGIFWSERDISQFNGISTFPRPLAYKGSLFILWENRLGDLSKLILLKPDNTVLPPILVAQNFTDGLRSRGENVRVRWVAPQDSSGIAGFNFIWTNDPNDSVPKRLKYLQDKTNEEFVAPEDGAWYVKVIAQDYAGNWSEPAVLEYYRDNTPPGVVTFIAPEKDVFDFLSSNTFNISWTPPDDDLVGGYTYRLSYIRNNRFEELPPKLPQGDAVSVSLAAETGDGEIAETAIENESVQKIPPGFQMLTDIVESEQPLLQRPPLRYLQSASALAYYNIDDGIWALSVTAIDTVGNFGEPATFYFRLNKYIPVTYITYVESTKDEIGRTLLNIYGRGFSVGGLVERLFIDKDGQEPYDFDFDISSGKYRVANDRFITDIILPDPKTADYQVGVVHPQRGQYVSNTPIAVKRSGAIKFGDFTRSSQQTGTLSVIEKFHVSLDILLLILLMSVVAAIIIFSVTRLMAITREGILLQSQVAALISGKRLISIQEKERLKTMKKKGLSLRLKFTLFFTLLVIAVVFMVGLPLGFYMIDTQERSLAEALRDRSEVLLESLASGGRAYLPSESTLELRRLPDQISAMEEATFTTITGLANPGEDTQEVVWASNDENILSKIDTQELVTGTSLLNDALSEDREVFAQELNEQAFESVKDLADQIDSLSQEALQLALRTDAESQTKLRDLQSTITALSAQLNTVLTEIGSVVKTYPEFSVENFNYSHTEYTFYKPILYRVRGQDVYFRGMIRLGVSTSRILQEIANSRTNLIRITGLIGLGAVILGIFGALILSSITVIPIKKLVSGVEKIRDTEDKSELKDHIIDVRTRDEISQLADAINQMTQGLVKAAVANKELTVGKEVQKMFIPLEKNERGQKKSTATESNADIEIYGYYEGAKGVSGDYFYYQQLDAAHYAIIKCDIAGKGVSASLIMVEVATIFLNYCKKVQLKRDGIKLNNLLSEINDLIAEREFKGRFAAMTVCIYNIKTGACHFANAGDTIVHYFDALEFKVKELVLPTAPAAGVFDSMMVDMQGGFKQISHKFNRGDILLLFTDGIEEAKRLFRTSDFKQYYITQEDIDNGLGPAGIINGAGDEELSLTRIDDIVNAVKNKSEYHLKKYFSPVADEDLVFDFSGLDGSTESIVLALISVEKVFRLVPDPHCTEEDKIHVDRKIDEFLQKVFVQYGAYFHHPIEDETDAEYINYAYLKEDEQYDDLTILGIMKK